MAVEIAGLRRRRPSCKRAESDRLPAMSLGGAFRDVPVVFSATIVL